MEIKHNLEDAINLILSNEDKRKFIESIDIVVNFNLGEKDDPLRGNFVLPKPMTKQKKIAIFAEPNSEKFKAAQESGADFVGMDDLMTEISLKKINYDIYLASPSLMAKLKKIASKLGPRNKMPNTKIGTLLENPETVVETMKNQTVFFKSSKGCIQTVCGDLAMEKSDIIENASSILKHLLDQFKNSYPNKDAIKSIFIKTTMGKAFEIEARNFV